MSAYLYTIIKRFECLSLLSCCIHRLWKWSRSNRQLNGSVGQNKWPNQIRGCFLLGTRRAETRKLINRQPSDELLIYSTSDLNIVSISCNGSSHFTLYRLTTDIKIRYSRWRVGVAKQHYSVHNYFGILLIPSLIRSDLFVNWTISKQDF